MRLVFVAENAALGPCILARQSVKLNAEVARKIAREQAEPVVGIEIESELSSNSNACCRYCWRGGDTDAEDFAHQEVLVA